MEKITTNISSYINNILIYINKLSPTLIVFIPLALLFLSKNLNGNEEQYMQLAKQYVNPNWIFESQNLSEIAGTRIIYQLIIGYPLKYLSFEATLLIFRFLLILGFSIVLGKIYKTLFINNIQILLHIAIFIIILDQNFFAGSWMLISVEPKGFAYFFVLLSFFYLLKSKLLLAIIFLITASYLHLLVGGYSFVYFFLTLLLFRKDYKLSFLSLVFGALIYSIFLIPFAIYLKTASLTYSTAGNEVSPSWIYTYFRSPHHTALFKSFKYFFQSHFWEILNNIIGLFIAILMYPTLQNRKNLRLINQFVIISMTGTLLLISIAFIDENGEILKFYLYRINTLSTFLFALLIPVWIYLLTKKEYLNRIQILIFAFSLMLFIKPALMNVYQNYNYSKTEKNIDDLSNYIRKNTDSKSLIFNYGENLSLIRKVNRNFFVVYKYIPAQLSKIQDWYNRVLHKRHAKEDPSKMKELVDNYGIDYIIIADNKIEEMNYKLIYQNSDFLLYETGVKTCYNN